MADPRVKKLAEVLIHYSLDLKPGQTLALRGSTLTEPLYLACYEEAIRAGAHVLPQLTLPGMDEIFFRNASDEQLEYISPVRQLVTEQFDASLYLDGAHNTRELSGIDPSRMVMARKAGAPLSRRFMERAANNELRWSLTVFPTQAAAMDAGMSLHDYENFVYGAGLLDDPDPVARWKEEGERQQKLIQWLAGRDQVAMKGEDIDLTLSIKGRSFKEADGKYNFPDGEIFTGPVETSVNGWVRFGYPAIYAGQEVEDIELWFENGKVVREKARRNQELLTALLNTDEGARYLGEWGIGTNYQIQRFTKSILFDEKIGGTIHLAVGASYPETGGRNESGVHWDMLCNMAQSEITVDGELFYKDGKPVI